MWTDLAKQGILNESAPWHPWLDDLGETNFPLGYATNYDVPGYPHDFTFLTIRMAGHMVPNTQPAASLQFFNHFLHNTTHRLSNNTRSWSQCFARYPTPKIAVFRIV